MDNITGSGNQAAEQVKKNTSQVPMTEQNKGWYETKKEQWMPWIEDQYLYWFSNDNKTSYATKDTLNKTKITGVDQVDTLQDGVNNLVGGQVGKGGLLQPVGDLVSKEGVNRAERGGKDDKGSYMGSAGESVSNAGSGIASGVTGAGNKAAEGAKGAGGYLSGAGSYLGFGGKKQQEGGQKK
ncbi:hypothetical protein LTS18_009702 [Coniosporium uncinatum]|uniref:Uncharacterized protein n=1 Tax=Coniosporium uncinatum TaxID=93489 RepID=A0ACC3D0H8_9PEZI|nr:hypothetical protein LTS18_009702 [Coniosporium uncinatum]